MRTHLQLEILPQPNDTTCGPTCLHAVYRYWGDEMPLNAVIESTQALEQGGGTLGVMLGLHALRRGYRARLMTFNLDVFDPSWFPQADDRPGASRLLVEKLRSQAEIKGARNQKLRIATEAYLEFIELGGEIWMQDLSSHLISTILRRGTPILTGLSSSYLYQCPREIPATNKPDDVRGEPPGHFVVLCGHDVKRRTVTVADPLEDNPPFESHLYTVAMSRLVVSIILGVLTYDANLLVIEPARQKAAGRKGQRK